MARLPEPHESATASHVQAKMGSQPDGSEPKLGAGSSGRPNVDVAHVSATRVTANDPKHTPRPEPKPAPKPEHRDKAAPKFSAPPLLPGSAVVYYGPDEAGVERVMHAIVLDVTGHEVGDEIVDLHVFNAQLALNGTTNADGRFESSAERHGVAHADAADATGWYWPGEFE
jgi:hypothetical protein